MRWALLVGLVACVGCGKGDADAPGVARSADGKPDVEVINPEVISDAYRDNPAAADQKYMGKVVKTPVIAAIERQGDEDVCRVVRAVMVRPSDCPDLVFRFASKGDPAKMTRNKVYHVQAVCQGLRGGVVEFTGARLLGEAPVAAPPKTEPQKGFIPAPDKK